MKSKKVFFLVEFISGAIYRYNKRSS